jgi:LPXTG-motif cell wall-anchored protein
VEEPPVEEPPVEEPPVVEVEEPPVEGPPVEEPPAEPEAPSEQHEVLPQTGGVSSSSIIGIIGFCLILAGALLYSVRKKLTAK